MEKPLKINSLGVNKAIKFHFDKDKLIDFGFKHYGSSLSIPPHWSWSQYKAIRGDLELTFVITYYDKPYKNSKLGIDVIDDDFGQIYNYQYILQRNPENKYALETKKWVEDLMQQLTNAGIISGHNYGEYI